MKFTDILNINDLFHFFWWKWFRMKMVSDESGFWWKWFLINLFLTFSAWILFVKIKLENVLISQFGSSSCSSVVLLAHNELLFCVFSFGVVPRRGSLAPDGWVQFIRGPHPPAQRWPVALGHRQPLKGPVQHSSQEPRSHQSVDDGGTIHHNVARHRILSQLWSGPWQHWGQRMGVQKPDSKQLYNMPKRRPRLHHVAHRPQRWQSKREWELRGWKLLCPLLQTMQDQKSMLSLARVAASPPFVVGRWNSINELDRVREVDSDCGRNVWGWWGAPDFARIPDHHGTQDSESPWRIVCSSEWCGFEIMFHTQSVCDKDCPPHYEGCISIGNSHGFGGDSWGSQKWQWCEDGTRVEVVHALAENVTLPSTSWRACSKEAFGGGRIHLHPKSISSTDTFIQTRFHPMTLSSKNGFIQWHFHPKHFHPILTLSSNDTFIQNTFIQQQFHPMNFSSNDIFIQWHFQPITVSSKTSHVVQSI